MPSLKELLVGLPDARVVGDENAEVASLAYDSRQVSAGTAFVAVRGTERDGHEFIEQAVQKAVFSQTVADIEARNSAVSNADIEATIDDALRQVRAEMWGTRTTKIVAKSTPRA